MRAIGLEAHVTENDPEMPSGRLLIGWATLENLLKMTTSRSVGMENDGAVIEVDGSELRNSNVAFCGEAAVEAVHAGTTHRLFTGLVESVRLEGSRAVVSLAGNHAALEETTIGGLVIGSGSPAGEMIFCLVRTTGWPADRIVIKGWQPGPREVFLVTTPVDGIEVEIDRTLAGVTLSASNPAQLDMPSEDPSVGRFLDASAWAFATVEADTVFDAEVAGLAVLDAGLSAFRAIGAYCYPVLADELRPFDRGHARAQIRPRDVVFVGSLTSKRRWLRVTTDRTALPILPIESILPDAVLASSKGQHPDQDLSRALREWRLAADTDDDFARVTNLWRSVECYSKRGKPDTLFTRAELGVVTSAALAAQHWNDVQIKRIKATLGAANSPPLLAKLRASIEDDEIELTEEQFDALVKTRSLRNDLEHGRTLTSLEHQALERAIAIMNFILVSAFIRDWSG